jgi:hypothetical protein
MATLSIPLDSPIQVTQQVATTAPVNSVTIDWILVMPTQRELRIKILGLNREVKLTGADYDAIIGVIDRDALIAAAREKVIAKLSPA